MKWRFFVFVLGIYYFNFAYQVEIKVVNVPSYMGNQEEIYITGNFNSWNPGNTEYKLTKIDNIYTLNFNYQGSIEFKFTKGDFLTVEKDVNCNEISNRTANINNDVVLEFTISNWRDYCEQGNQHTATSNVSILNENFNMPEFNTSRRIWIYLPPDYQTSNKEYKVIYMQDGQNLFDNFYSFSGEWGIDESLNSLFNQGDEGAIVVGIDNGGSTRINEYTPWSNSTYGGGQGDLYIDFLVNTLKPYIDNNFRTKADRNNTALIGSSLGGLISFYGGIEAQNTFSKIGVFSPSFWFSNQIYPYISNSNLTNDTKFYFVAGSQESTNMVTDIDNVINAITNKGITNQNIKRVIKSDGQHAEWFWKREFPAAYQWLFQENTNAIPEKKNIDFKITQTETELNIELNDISKLTLYDLNGKIIYNDSKKSTYTIDKTKISKGTFILQLNKKMERIYIY